MDIQAQIQTSNQFNKFHQLKKYTQISKYIPTKISHMPIVIVQDFPINYQNTSTIDQSQIQ